VDGIGEYQGRREGCLPGAAANQFNEGNRLNGAPPSKGPLRGARRDGDKRVHVLVQIASRYRHTFSMHVDFPVERIKYQQFLYQITQAFGWLITESSVRHKSKARDFKDGN
jgi:hypothetical protein